MGLEAKNNPFDWTHLRVYGGRLWGMLDRHSWRGCPNCFFMHLPECGGTSVARSLVSMVPLHRRVGEISRYTRNAVSIVIADQNSGTLYHEDGPGCPALFEFREALLLYYMASDAALVFGHVLFSEKAYRHFGDSYRFITVMREPVARLVSNYHGSAMANCDFKTYLRSDTARRHALVFLRYFSGVADVSPGQERSLLPIAHRNMGRFALIGFLDRLNEFTRGFRDLFGVEPKTYYENVNPLAKIEITPDIRREVEKLCAPDLELYEAARSGTQSMASAGVFTEALRDHSQTIDVPGLWRTT